MSLADLKNQVRDRSASGQASMVQPRNNGDDIRRLLPQAPDAEKGVLCAMLLAPDECIPKVRSLDAETFHDPANRILFSAIRELHYEPSGVDFVTLGRHLEMRGQLANAGGGHAVSALFTFLPTVALFDEHLDIVIEAARKRAVIAAATKAKEAAWENASSRHSIEIIDELDSTLGIIRETGEDTWGEPEPIRAELRPVAILRAEMIPEPYRDWLCDVAHRMQCPLDFVASAAVVMTSIVIGTACGIRPKRNDDWTVTPNLWGAVVGEPSMLKTPALAEALRPLDRLEATAKEAYDQATEEHDAELEIHKARRDGLRSEMQRSARKPKNGGECSDGGEDWKQRLIALAPPPTPVWRRFKTNDATVEKLAELMGQNPRGLLVFRDELIGLFASWDREGHESDRAFHLEAWNGTGGHTSDRIGRGTATASLVCESVFGGIQPSKLLAYLRQTCEGTANDGLMQRLQLFVFPDSPRDWQLVDKFPNHAAKNRAFAIVERLAAMDFAEIGATLDGGKIPSVRFAEDAQEFFYEWLRTLEMQKLRNPAEDAFMVQHLAKYRSLMPSLALVFHLIGVADGSASGGVSLVAARQAADWCDYLETHARRVYGLVGDSGIRSAAALAAKIEAGALHDGFTARDVYRAQWSGLDDTRSAQQAIDELLGAGWLRKGRSPVSKPGPRSVEYRIHPKLRRP
jgi:hypothetical protein